MEEITMSKAVNAAKQMVLTFRAFSLIEEVLDKAVKAESLLKELDKKKAALQGEIEILSQKKVQETDAYRTMLTQAETRTASAIEQLNGKIKDLEEKVKAKEKEAETRQGALMDEWAKAEKEHRERMESLNKTQAAAEAKLQSTRSELEALKRKLE